MTSPTALLRRAAAFALDELLPPRCALCGRHGPLLCIECAMALPLAGAVRCTTCWQTSAAAICPRCAEYGSELDAVRAPYEYSGGARQLITAVKYGGLSSFAEPMAELLAAAWSVYAAELGPVDAVIPVPLHGRRRRVRGFNQAEILAKGMAKRSALPHIDRALVRTRAAPPQVRTAGPAERRANVWGSFACSQQSPRRVLLVDDVLTTGATLSACGVALRLAGADRVIGLTFAVAG